MAVREKDDLELTSTRAGNTTPVAVPSSDVVFYFPLHGGTDETLGVLFGGVFLSAISTAIGIYASRNSSWVMGLIAVVPAAGFVWVLQTLRRKRYVEITSREIRVVGSARTIRIDRREITEANILPILGHRHLVVATPSKDARIAQREVAPHDWEQLVALLRPSGS